MIQAIVKWHNSTLADIDDGGISFTYSSEDNCFKADKAPNAFKKCPERPSRFRIALEERTEQAQIEIGYLEGVFIPEYSHHRYSSWREFYRKDKTTGAAVESALAKHHDFLRSKKPCAITATVEDMYISREDRLHGYGTALLAKLDELLGAAIIHGPDVILLTNMQAYEIDETSEGKQVRKTHPNQNLAQLRLVRLAESAGYSYNTDYSCIRVCDANAQRKK